VQSSWLNEVRLKAVSLVSQDNKALDHCLVRRDKWVCRQGATLALLLNSVARLVCREHKHKQDLRVKEQISLEA